MNEFMKNKLNGVEKMEQQVRNELINQLQEEVIFLQNKLNKVSELYQFCIKGDGSLSRTI